MCDCSLYHMITESVLNGIGFGFFKKNLGSLISHTTLLHEILATL